MYHPGCPSFDLDMQGKQPVSILNELAPKLLKCHPEFIVTTQEDPVDPYLCSIICEGIVIARAGYLNKKASRQVAAQKALSVIAPLLDVPISGFEEGVKALDLGDGVLGARGATIETLEAQEAQTLRLSLNDDAILD